jgi:uncharacterized membrane protein
MDMATTLTSLMVSLTLLGFANWRSRRPYVMGKLPLIPWNGVQFVALVVAIALLAHVFALAGSG